MKRPVKTSITVNKRKIKPRTLKKAPEVLLPGRNVRVQSRQAFAEEIAKRRADQSSVNNTLLMPDEVSGNYYLERGLMTSLHGEMRPITIEDLQHFRHKVNELKTNAKKDKIRGGITAKQIIDKSWSADRQRAQQQIAVANPTHYKAVTEGGGQGSSLLVHFMTSAGPDSEFTHHNVNVQFLDFGAAVASPMPAEKAGKMLAEGRLKFECNCGRFKYFFRYVCTVAEIVCGRQELAYPKIRNPGITGISCKHGLRTMQTIAHSPTMKTYLAKVIQRFRDDISHTEHVEKIADQREFEAARKKESSRQRKIQTTEQKRAARQAQPANVKRRQEAEARNKKRMIAAEKDKAKKRIAKDTAKAKAAIERHARELLNLGAITKAQFNQMMKAAQGK